MELGRFPRLVPGKFPAESDHGARLTTVFYWLMKYVVIGPVVKAIFRPWIVGRKNVPASGAAILASNHLSFADSIFLPLVIDRKMSFLAKSDYFTGRGLKGWATKFFMSATGQIPIDRSGGKASEASLNTGLQVLGGETCSVSIPRARAAPTERSTADAPASRGWRWRRRFPSCP